MGYIDVAFQTYTFLLSLCIGCGFCIVYDFLRAVRRFRFNGPVATFITDIVFWLFAGLVTYCFLLVTVKGQVRSFVVFGVFSSFLLFRLLFSRFTFAVFVKILTIFDLLLRMSSKFADKILSTINKSFKNMVDSCKKVLQPRVVLLYNNLKVYLSERTKDRRGSRDQA